MGDDYYDDPYRLPRVGNFSPLEMSTEYFMVPSMASVSNSVHMHHQSTSTSATVYKSPIPIQSSFFRREVWVPPLLVLSSLTMLLIILFEVFVLCKTWRTVPSRRHLFLGQMLLSGLFVCSAVSAVITAEPTAVSCAVVRFGIGLGYSLVFSTLLVKCVFLISLNGGVYLPAPYQALLLFFAVAIQIAIDVQWLINTPPKIVQGSVSSSQVCQTPYHHMLFSLVYVVFLIVVVTVLALKSRGIRDNYREAMFIAIALCSVIPVWIGWTVSGFMAYEKNRDACLAFGLSITSIIVFLIMFMPKGRQLAAMGREGMYIEDRDEKYSTISRPGSPSFFHFKPVKPTFSASKHPSAMNTYGAKPIRTLKIAHQWNGKLKDRVALVAAPPTYAHHYYPCCYYPQPHTHSRTGPPGSGLLETNLYTTIEPTLSSNPNVFFQRSGLHSGMMY